MRRSLRGLRGRWRSAQLDAVGRRQQHREAGARIARRGALLAQHHGRPRLAGVELGRQLFGDLAPAPSRAARRSVRARRWRWDRARLSGSRRSSSGAPGAAFSDWSASACGGGRRPPRPPSGPRARSARVRRAPGSGRIRPQPAGSPRATAGRRPRGTSSAPRRSRRPWPRTRHDPMPPSVACPGW